MKLLLTSGGITNNSISGALFDLTGKKPQDTTIVFIPTASNVEMGDKDWFVNDLINIKKQNFKSLAITDISAVSEKIWKPQLEEADILFFEGGNTYHLMRWVNESGLGKVLPQMLESKVYVGVSAGSMIAGPDLNIHVSKIIYGEEVEDHSMAGLGLVDFYFLPHLNDPYFMALNKTNLEKALEGLNKTVYALDDQSAIKVVDGKVEIISEGDYLKFS